MTPTAKLRFVIRYEPTPVRILQQWWEKDIASRYNAAIAGDPSGEWRDVPIEKEQA